MQQFHLLALQNGIIYFPYGWEQLGAALQSHSNPTKKKPTQTILLACQINKGNCWLLQFEKPKEMDYSVFKICIEEGGRVDSHPRQADLVPPAGILNQSQSITARAAQIHNHWNSGGHCPQEALPVLELWLIQALHFLSLQPLPQVLGIL